MTCNVNLIKEISQLLKCARVAIINGILREKNIPASVAAAEEKLPSDPYIMVNVLDQQPELTRLFREQHPNAPKEYNNVFSSGCLLYCQCDGELLVGFGAVLAQVEITGDEYMGSLINNV